MVEKMRDSDYIGIMEDDQLYVLLANTGQENAVIVQKRFEENGYRTEIVEEIKYVPENEIFYIFTCDKFYCGCDLCDLEPFERKRKKSQYMDEGDRDAFMPGGRTDVSLCSLFAVQAVYVTGDGSFRCCFQQRESQNLYSSG